MSLSGGGPGKTAPKLYNDFRLFDPLCCDSQSNYLADVALPVGDGPQIVLDQRSCQHDYTLKDTQSVLPPLDSRPTAGSQYKAAVVCKKCRIHADVHIRYETALSPCPNSKYPQHHFLRRDEHDEISDRRITYYWQCSSPDCEALLLVRYRMRRLDDGDKQLLIDSDKLRRRYEAMWRENPERDGLKQATPIDALNRLKKYISDSLLPENARRTFSAHNKRFGEAFGVNGQDCYDLLTRLGFTFTCASNDEPATWMLPNPGAPDDALHAQGSSHHELLQDIVYELIAMQLQVASSTGSSHPAAVPDTWPSAETDTERVLAAQGYARLSQRTRISNEKLPYYASLGVQPDSSDSLVEFAFDRQVACDPARQAYYFECLQEISESRQTESLQMKVTMLSSQDLISRRDLFAAYRHLNISKDEHAADDERILNLFHVHISDSGPLAQEEARQALGKIGLYRQSQRLINASKQTLETYEEALSWISNGVDKNSSDEALLAVVAVKVTENPDNQALAEKAISIIAGARRSDTLNNWLLTGQTGGYKMGVEEALRILGINDTWDAIDKTLLPMTFDSARADRPGEQTEKAITTLEEVMIGTASVTHSLETWPVGLTSHGNTCYLNSILQYYFSIKPLRDIVLNYDTLKLDTSTHAKKTERVGLIHITLEEILGGQKFAEDLKCLFERMITEPAEHVKPEQDLVCRAFLNIRDFKLLAPDAKELQAQDAAMEDGTEDAIEEKPTIDGDAAMEMKNDLPPTPPASPRLESKLEPTGPPPLPPRRFSTTREQALVLAEDKAKQQQDVTEVHDGIMFRLRAGIKPNGQDENGEQKDALQDLYSLRMEETAVKNGIEGKKITELNTSILVTAPAEATNIYELLDGYFDLQAGGGTSESYKTIRSLPPLVQISIPRILYDQARGIYKSEAPLRLEDELFLDRYADQSPDVLPKRKACFAWRKQLHAARKEQKALSTTTLDLDGATATAETVKYLERLEDVNRDLQSVGVDVVETNGGLLSALRDDAELQAERLRTLETEISGLEAHLKDQFVDMKDLKYRLAAVFVHRGTVGHGHYWVFIHDFERGIWRKYNDETVTEQTQLNEIFDTRTWEHGTPTYVVYVKDDLKTKVIQPVCRVLKKAPILEAVAWTPQPRTYLPNDTPQDVDMSNGIERTEIESQLVDEGRDVSWDTPRQVHGGNQW